LPISLNNNNHNNSNDCSVAATSNSSFLVTPSISDDTLAEINTAPQSYPPTINKIAANHIACKTMKLTDSRTGREYLVDSGAEVSVFPSSEMDRRNTPSERLLAANKSSIAAFGRQILPLCFGTSTYEQEFVVADVTQPILGANFFITNSLLIDLANARII
jgi:hypothetical protein